MTAEPHKEAAAELWGQTGAAYDFISFGLSDTLGHAVQRLWPHPGEHVLDLGCGTGWTTRLAAQAGARVTGADIAPGMLEAARALSAHLDPAPDYVEADAEALPFEDAAFDGVLSTYGVMFAGRPVRAAAELARVTRPGGRLVLATWADAPEGYIARFFALVAGHAGAPSPEVSPMVWGDEDWLQEALGDAFELHVEPRVSTFYAPDPETVWQKYLHGFGPVRMTAAALEGEALEAFRQDFRALHAECAHGPGLRIDRQAVLVCGMRR